VAQVMDILAQKDTRVHVVSPTATVLEATLLMNRHHVGALVVTIGGEEGETDSGRVAGMFTERDVLTRVVGERRDPATTRVEEVMTEVVAFCRPETELEEVASIMRSQRIRHLPVCDDDARLRGMISIGDVNAWHARGLDATISYLHEYIHGRV